MVLLVTTIWVPASKAIEVGKKFLEVSSKYPDDPSSGKSVLRVAVKTTKDGIKTMGITEIVKGKVEEVLANANEQMLLYSEIEGLRYKIETWMSGTEALPLVGLKMPKW
jgi:hypothetical protein